MKHSSLKGQHLWRHISKNRTARFLKCRIHDSLIPVNTCANFQINQVILTLFFNLIIIEFLQDWSAREVAAVIFQAKGSRKRKWKLFWLKMAWIWRSVIFGQKKWFWHHWTWFLGLHIGTRLIVPAWEDELYHIISPKTEHKKILKFCILNSLMHASVNYLCQILSQSSNPNLVFWGVGQEAPFPPCEKPEMM